MNTIKISSNLEQYIDYTFVVFYILIGQAEIEATKQKMEQLKTTPHFWNLNEYPNLTGKVIHFTPQGRTRLGSNKANPPPEVTLAGLSIQPEHALVENDGNKKVTLLPLMGAKVVLNGNEIMDKKELHHNDRVMFGITNLFVFHHPQDLAKQQIENKTVATPSYVSAQQEITQKFDLSKFMSGGKSEDDLLKRVLLEVVPMINEANAISEELEKNCKFEVALIPPRLEGRKTEMCVKMCNLGNDTEFIWDRSKFINRKFLIQKMYQSYMDGDEYWDLPKDKDPFWEDPNTEVCLGSIVVYLQSLAYMMEIEENMQVMDYRGMEQGHLQVVIIPCKKDGTELTDDYVDDPEELVGKDLHFKVKILNAQGLPGKFVSTCCKYKMYLDGQPTTTKEVAGMNPEYGYEKQYVFHPVTNQFVDYLQNDALIIEVWGRQKAGSGTSLSTKVLKRLF
ncbi:Kinesin-like protein KIF28P [Lamellibrachia satsuma]|nr:Kinesin-like protein KIF28P [Lamellibrachia satsuma]